MLSAFTPKKVIVRTSAALQIADSSLRALATSSCNLQPVQSLSIANIICGPCHRPQWAHPLWVHPRVSIWTLGCASRSQSWPSLPVIGRPFPWNVLPCLETLLRLPESRPQAHHWSGTGAIPVYSCPHAFPTPKHCWVPCGRKHLFTLNTDHQES